MQINKKFRWINEDVIIDFPVPKTIQNAMQEAEELDLEGNIEYTHVADILDVLSKGCVAVGKLSQKQWDKIVLRYPVV